MKIIINNLNCLSLVGCNPEERIAPQPVIVSLECTLYPFQHSREDNLADTIDYTVLVAAINIILKTAKYQLLESLAQHTADNLLQQFKLIKHLKIKLIKPQLSGIMHCDVIVEYATQRKFAVALALGSNHIYPQQQLISAIELLSEHISNIQIGRFYTTTPVGFSAQANFCNTAIIGYTSLNPSKLLVTTKKLEKLMGKVEVCENGPRIIDIDILLFGEEQYQHDFLVIPHLRMHQRDFVLKPLMDIAPNWIHPKFNKTISELYNDLDKSTQSIISDEQ